MTKKERQKINSIIQYLKDSNDFNRVKKIRQVVGINSHFNEDDEIKTILDLYDLFSRIESNTRLIQL